MTRSRNAPRKVPRQERARATVEAILEATRQLLIHSGYEGTSTAQIAERAGVSIGSLYQYFPSKEAILLALSRRHSETMLPVFRLCAQRSRELPLRAAVRQMIEVEIAALQRDPVLHRELFTCAARLGAEHIVQVQQQLIEVLAQELRRRPELGHLEDPRLAAFLLVHAVDGVLQAALQQRPELLHAPALLDQCTELVMHHLQAPLAARGAAR